MSNLPQCFNKTISRLVNKGDKIALALSGGVDSMSLLHLLRRYNKTDSQDLQITCITVDHNYRDLSSQEAVKIGELISNGTTDIRHVISKIEWERDLGINLDKLHDLKNFEEIARRQRYSLMISYCQRHGIGKLIMGHTLNDQVETFVLRLLSHSSIFGLRCMSFLSPSSVTDVELVRPLLGIGKQKLYQYSQGEKLTWFEDVTNTDTTLTQRNRIRKLLIDGEISTGKILQLIDDVRVNTDMIRDRMISLMSILRKNDDYHLDMTHLSINLNLNQGWWSSDDNNNNGNKLLMNRFLWCLNHQISPLSLYHYTYSSNLKMFDYIGAYIKGSSDTILKFNTLGSLWQLSKIDNFVNIKISREPPRSTPEKRTPIHNGDFIYDNRLNISIKDNNTPLYISLITESDLPRLKKFKQLINEPSLKSSSLLYLPCITDEDNEIIGLPTLNKWSPSSKLELKCQLVRQNPQF